MSKKLIKSLVDNIIDTDPKLVEYRHFLAIEDNGITCMCPDRDVPCNSSCIFFSISKSESVFEKKKKYHIRIDCRHLILQIVVGL